MYIEIPNYFEQSVRRLKELSEANPVEASKQDLQEIDDLVSDIVYHVASVLGVTLQRDKINDHFFESVSDSCKD